MSLLKWRLELIREINVYLHNKDQQRGEYHVEH